MLDLVSSDWWTMDSLGVVIGKSAHFTQLLPHTTYADSNQLFWLLRSFCARIYCVSSNIVDAWIRRHDLGHQLLVPSLGVVTGKSPLSTYFIPH